MNPGNSPVPFSFRVSEGDVPGYTKERKFGHNKNLTTTAAEYVVSWGATSLSIATSADTVDLFGSVNDIVGGTGAEEVTIVGLDADYNELTEAVAMNGATRVTTTGQFIWINRMFVSEAGSLRFNAGTITAEFTSAPGTTISEIPYNSSISRGYSQTQQMAYVVPAGYTAFVQSAEFSARKGGAGNPRVTVYGIVRDVTDGIDRIIWEREIDTSNDGQISTRFDYQDPIPEKTMLAALAETTANGAIVTGEFEVRLKRNQ